MSRIFRDLKLEMEVLLFLAGLILFIIGFTGIFFPDNSPEFLKSIHNDLGHWTYWCAVIGFLLIIGGGWYMVDDLRKRREFEKLINTDSKAKFIKKIDRIEYLAWMLTSDHEKRLWEKKKEFDIKT